VRCQSDIGVGAVDLDIDRGHRQLINSTLTGHDQRGQRASGLTQEQKNQAVKYHNKLRKQEGASNMEKMVNTLHPRQLRFTKC